MNCEHFEHMLVERSEGLLDERGLNELEAHLASCRPCREAAAHVGEMVGRLASAGAAFGAVSLHVPSEVFTGTSAVVHGPASPGRGHGAVSRRHRVVRWVAPLAAAAAIGVAMLFPLGVFDRNAGRAEAATTLSAMSRALDEVRRVAVEVRFVAESEPVQVGRLLVVDLVYRVDMPDGRVIISDAQSGRTQIRLPSERKVIEAPRREAAPIDLYEKLARLAVNPSQDLGIEAIDGIPARVFIVSGVDGPQDANEYKVWINPHTSLPMKVEMTGRGAEVAQSDGPPGRLVLAQFVWGSDVDVAEVAFTPPAGFDAAPITADPKATRMEVQVAARNVLMGTMVSQQMRGEWPRTLQQLVDGGQVTAEQVRNVRAAPGSPDYGWIYVPQTSMEYDANRVVITEPAPEPWTEVVIGFADGHVEIVSDRARYESLLAAAGWKPPEPKGAPLEVRADDKLDRSTAVNVDPAKPEDGPGAIKLTGRLPLFTLNKDDLQGLSTTGNAVTEGDGRFEPSRLRENPRLPRELQVNTFAASDDTLVAIVPVGPDNTKYGMLSDAAASIDRTKAPALIDRVGQRFPALGFVYLTDREFRVRYYPSKPIASVSALPTMSASKPKEKLFLVFQVSAGAELTGLAVGDKLVANFQPGLATKVK